MYKRFVGFVLLLLVSSQAEAFFFPELPFCPLGGPPGWANRVINDDYYRYPPPGYPYSPYMRPGFASPYAYSGGLPPKLNRCGNSGSGSCPFDR